MEERIERTLQRYNVKLTDSSQLAQAVLRQSDFYIQNPKSVTPWSEPWARLAQLAYFLPLNYIRSSAVFARGTELGFFQGLESYYEVGCGLGPTFAAAPESIQNFKLIDRASSALQISKELWADFKNSKVSFAQESVRDDSEMSDSSLGAAARTLTVFSYTLTEFEKLPRFTSEGLLILEPSTQEDGRRLQQFRAQLIQQGYSIWAPCTHHQSCPLLEQSKVDWCHDRVHFDRPEWLKNIERHLPMRNETLTFSYLLARKQKRPDRSKTEVRLVGDTLPERGKTRQLICRGPDREFLALLHKKFGKDIELPRGELVDLGPVEKISNEIRPDASQINP